MGIIYGLGDPDTTTYDTGADGAIVVVTTVDFNDPDAVWLSHKDKAGNRLPWTRLAHDERNDLANIDELGQNKYKNGTLLKIDSSFYVRDNAGGWTTTTPASLNHQPAPTVRTEDENPGQIYADRRADGDIWFYDDGQWVVIGVLEEPPEGFSPAQESVNPPEDCVSQGSGDVHATFTFGTIVALDTDSGLYKVAHVSAFLGFGNDDTDTAGQEGEPIWLNLTAIIREHSVLGDGNFYFITGYGPAALYQAQIAGEEVSGYVDGDGYLRGFDGSWVTLALANNDYIGLNFSLQVSND